jgi:hypothetical protein
MSDTMNRSQARQRRFRLGPSEGGSGWSPMLSSSSRQTEDIERFWLDREMGMLEQAVNENGEVKRSELGRMVGCRYWGPGRYGRALRKAVDEGRIRRVRRGVYGPANRSATPRNGQS